MRVSIRKTVVAAVAAPVSTPAEAQFMVATDFMEAVSIAVAFTAEAGAAAGTAGVGVVAAGADPDGPPAGVGAVQGGAAAVGIAAAGAGAVVGAGVGIRGGRSRRRLCPPGSRSLRSLHMTADPVAGRGGACGPRAATIWAGGL
jgi:hypothetical protein